MDNMIKKAWFKVQNGCRNGISSGAAARVTGIYNARTDTICSITDHKPLASSPRHRCNDSDRTKTQQGQIRGVKFVELVKVRMIEHAHDDFSKDELAAYWYSKYEYRRIRYKAAYPLTKVAISHDKQGGDNGIQHCVRGLERRHPESALELRQRHHSAIVSVLEEQASLAINGCDDSHAGPDMILAKTYMELGAVSRKEAARRGERDTEEVSRMNSWKASNMTDRRCSSDGASHCKGKRLDARSMILEVKRRRLLKLYNRR